MAQSTASRNMIVHRIAACGVAFVWAWHGLVPKLLGPHPDELTVLLNYGYSEATALRVVRYTGVFELCFGAAFLLLARHRWPWLLTLALMGVATVSVLAFAREQVFGAFNPISLNLSVAVMATIGLLTRKS